MHVVPKQRGSGRASALAEAADAGDDAAADDDDDDDDEEALLSLITRPNPLGGRYTDFDRSDGWATAKGIEIKPIQEWLLARECQVVGHWIEYGGTGNTLQYLLDKSHEHHAAMAAHLQRWFGPSAPEGGRSFEGFENPSNWEAVPACVHSAVEQMRQVLVDPETKEPLLAEFELAFAQFTRMPVCDINRANHPSGLAPAPAGKGRSLGAHWDSPGYLEVIVTIDVFGEADVQLLLPPMRERRSGVLPRERTEGITISAGSLYAIWGKSRWKMYHDAIVGRNERAVPGMRAETARVGLTLRFARRSFAQLQSPRRAPLPTAQLQPGTTVVDALYYDMEGVRVNEHAYPHTYPALVLEVATTQLHVLYISDGLIPDDDDEAWSFGVVPIQHAVLASTNVERRCKDSRTRAGRMTIRLLDDIATGEHTGGAWRGAADFVCALRSRGAAAMCELLKRSPIVG